MRRCLFVGVVCAAVVSLAMTAPAFRQSDLEPVDGQRLLDKLVEITDRVVTPDVTNQSVIIHQREINAYLQFQAVTELPTGITDAEISLLDGGVLSVRATVDLSLLRDAQPQETPDLLRYLSGRVPVTVDGEVRGQNGVAHVDVELVTIAGLSVPVSVLTDLVRRYSTGEQYPDGIDFAEPLNLPYGMSELRVEHERVVVVH